MIAEATISLEEEDSFPTQKDLHSLYSSIKVLIKTYIESNTQSLDNKIEKLTSINDIISTLIASDKPISFEKIDSLITSLQNQLTLLKAKEDSNQKEIVFLKNCLNQNMTERWKGLSPEDATLNKIKRKLKNKEINYQLKELDYLFCINDQSKRIKELQMKKTQYNEKEINQVRMFPYIVHTTDTNTNTMTTGFRLTTRSRTNASRNKSKMMTTVGNTTNYTIRNKKIGLTEEIDDCDEKGCFSERSNREKIVQIMQDNHNLKEMKSNKDLINYKLYQKSHLVKQAHRYDLKNNMQQISNLIRSHQKNDLRSFNPLLKKATRTCFGSFK